MASINFDIRGDNSNFLRSVQGAQRGVQTSISQIEKATGGVTRTFNQMKDSAVGGFKQIAMGMAGITTLLQSGSFLKGLIDEMGEFTVAMKEVSTLSQDVAKDLDGWKAKVVEMTTEIPIGAVEAAKAMYQIESAGHHGADAMNVLKESAKGAIAGVTETETVADAITTILNSYNMSADEAAHVSDLLFTTVRLGKTRMDELAHTIAQAAPIASTYGVAIEEVLAAVATLTKSGTPTAMAMRQVRSAIVAVTKSLGDGAFEGKRFIDAMQEVANGTGESMNELRKELANLQALNGVLAMTGKNYSRAEQDLEDMKNSTNAASDAYDKMADTAGNSATLLKNNLFKALEPIGDSMKGLSKSITDALNEGFNTGAVQNFADALGALALTYGIYRAAIASTNAVQSIQTATMTAGYNTEIAELDALIATQETEISVRMQEAVAKGQITAEQAALITSLQGEVAARRQQLAVAAEDLAMKATQAEAALQLAVSEKAAADSMLASAQERLAAARASNVQSEIDIATEEVRIATLMQGTAAENVNVASHQASIATQSAETAAKVANTAATVTETGAVSGDTVATGLLASAKTALTAVQNALNASMLASPLFWIAAVIVGVTYAVYELATAENAHDAAVRSTNEALEEQADELEKRKNETNKLIRTIQDVNATEYERIKAYKDLKNIAPEITKEYTREELAALDAADAQRELNEAFDEAEYNETKKKLEEYRAALEKFKNHDWGDILDWKEKLEIPFGTYFMNGGQSVIDGLEAAVAELENKVYEIEQIKKEASQDPLTIEVDVKMKEVEDELGELEDWIMDWVDQTNDAMKLGGPLVKDQAFNEFDNAMQYFFDEYEKLKQDVENDPTNIYLQAKQSEFDAIYNAIITQKNWWMNNGATTIDWWFRLHYIDAQTGKETHTTTATSPGGRGGGGHGGGGHHTSRRHSGGSGHRSGSTTKQKTKEEIDYNIREIVDDLNEDADDAIKEIADDITKAFTESLKDGFVKESQAISDSETEDLYALDEKKNKLTKAIIEAYKDIWEEQNQNKKKWQYDVSDEDALSRMLEMYPEIKKKYETLNDEILHRHGQITANTIKETNKLIAENLKELNRGYYEFFKEWGGFIEKRNAIELEYQEKLKETIKNGGSPSDMAALAMSRDKQLEELSQTEFEQNVDWEGVFSQLEGHTKEYLEGLAKQLQGVLSEGKLPVDQLAIIQDKLRSINGMIREQGNMFHYVGERRQEYLRLQQAQKDAEDNLVKAKEDEKIATESLFDAQTEVLQFLVDDEDKIINNAQDLLDNHKDIGSFKIGDEILNKFLGRESDYEDLAELLSKLRVAEGKLAQAREKTSKATEQASNAEDKAKRSSAQTVADWFYDAQQYITSQSLDQIPELLSSVGLEAASEKAEKGFTAFAKASEAANDFAKGNYFGAALKGVSAILNIGEALGFGGVSDKSLEKDVERLTASNEALLNSIQELTEEMQNSAVVDAKELYEQMKANLATSEANMIEIMSRTGAVYNRGTLGFIGGKHSSNAYIDDNVSAEQWRRVSIITGKSVKNAADFWQLTSEQMYKVAKDAPEIYALIKNHADDGYKDVSEYMDDYIDYWKQLQEAEDAYFEKLTSTSMDTISSDFANSLMDMEKSSADFAESFENYMKTAIINALVSEKYKPLLEEWYGDFADAMVNGVMSDTAAAALRNRWTQITNMGLVDRDMLQKQFGWGSTGDGEGSGAYKAASTFTQEQGDELNGRLAALQIGQERINANVTQAIEQLRGLSVFFVDGGGVLGEIRNLVMMGNSHLEDISRYTRIASQYGDMINEIANKIKTL